MTTADNLTDEQIAEWYRTSGMGYHHMIMRCDALGLAAGPCYQQPSDEAIQDAREQIAAAINARKGN